MLKFNSRFRKLITNEHSLRIIEGIVLAMLLAIGSYAIGLWPHFLYYLNLSSEWLSQEIQFSRMLVILMVTGTMISMVFLLERIFKTYFKNSHDSYLEDIFHGILWRWKNSSSDNEIWDVTPYCPTDNRKMIDVGDNYSKVHLFCEACKFQFGPLNGRLYQLEDRIKREVESQILNGTWKSARLRINAEQLIKSVPKSPQTEKDIAVGST